MKIKHEIIKALEDLGFSVNGNIISYRSFSGKIIKEKDYGYYIKGSFLLFGHEFEEGFCYIASSNEIQAGGCDHLSYRFNYKNIDFNDLDIKMLNAIGIGFSKDIFLTSSDNANFKDETFEINCSSYRMYSNSDSFIGNLPDLDKIKNTIKDIKRLKNLDFSKYPKYKNLFDAIKGLMNDVTEINLYLRYNTEINGSLKTFNLEYDELELYLNHLNLGLSMYDIDGIQKNGLCLYSFEKSEIDQIANYYNLSEKWNSEVEGTDYCGYTYL